MILSFMNFWIYGGLLFVQISSSQCFWCWLAGETLQHNQKVNLEGRNVLAYVPGQAILVGLALISSSK